MAVIRVERNSNYTTMSNYHLRDCSLSLKAKGLLSLFLSLPDEWHYSISGLSKITKEGKGALTTTVRELEKAGYLIRNQKRLKDGKVGDIEYVIFERPQEKQENSCGVHLVRYGDGAAKQDAAVPQKLQGIEEQEEETNEDFEWGSDEGMAGTALAERPVSESQMMECQAAKDAAGENPAEGEPAAKNWAAGNPVVGNSTAENSAANNPAGLKTDISKTYKSKTDGINKREIDRAREGLPHRYGTYANVFLTDEEFATLKREFPVDYDQRIERLSAYMASKGRNYSNHLATIQSWARWDADKQKQGVSYGHDRYRFREGESL